MYLFFKAVPIIIICKTNSAGIKIIFQSISSQPVFSDTKAKLIDKKRQRNIVFIIILFWVVLIFDKKIAVLVFGLISRLIDLIKIKIIEWQFLTETRKECYYTSPKSFAMAIKWTLLLALKYIFNLLILFSILLVPFGVIDKFLNSFEMLSKIYPCDKSFKIEIS